MNPQRIAFVAAALAMTAGLSVAAAQPPGDLGALGAAPGFDAFAAGGGPGSGGPPGGRHGRPGFPDPRRVADYLGLSEDQRASARQLFEQQRENVRPLIEQQRALRQQLDSLLDDPNASDAALGQLVKQLRANRQTLEASRNELEGAFASLLDEAQKAKLEQMKSVRDGLGMGRRHRGARR